MLLTLNREKDFISKLYIDGQEHGWILENPDKAIPAGTYEISLQYSPGFKRYHLELLNVPGRNNILIHTGNWYSDSLGCLITGQTKKLDLKKVEQSKISYYALMAKIRDYIFADPMAKTDPIKIKITNYKE